MQKHKNRPDPDPQPWTSPCDGWVGTQIGHLGALTVKAGGGPVAIVHPRPQKAGVEQTAGAVDRKMGEGVKALKAVQWKLSSGSRWSRTVEVAQRSVCPSGRSRLVICIHTSHAKAAMAACAVESAVMWKIQRANTAQEDRKELQRPRSSHQGGGVYHS